VLNRSSGKSYGPTYLLYVAEKRRKETVRDRRVRFAATNN
jgi:hypothetical protein